MPNSPRTKENPTDLDHNTDRAPTFPQALRKILDSGTFDQTVIERLEVQCLQSGEVTYRYWERHAEDPEGGVIS